MLVHAIAVVPQDTKSTRCTIKDVESKICNSHVLRRARIRETESFKGLNKTHITYILASLKSDNRVSRLWIAPSTPVHIAQTLLDDLHPLISNAV